MVEWQLSGIIRANFKKRSIDKMKAVTIPFGVFTKKVVVILLMFFVIWQLALMLKREIALFPLMKVFSLEMFLSNRLDPVSMLEESFDEVLKDTQENWCNQGLKIKVIRKGTEEDLNFATYEPTVGMVYVMITLNGKEVRKFVNLHISEKCASIFSALGGIAEDMMQEVNEDWIEDVRLANKFERKDYADLRKEFPEIKYSFEEILVMRANGMTITMLHSLAHLVPASRCIYGNLMNSFMDFPISKDETTNGALKGYAKYFYDKNSSICRWAAITYGASFILLCLIVILLVFHLVRVDLVTVLEREIAVRKIKILPRYYYWVCFKNWRVVFFTDSRANLIKLAKTICAEYEQWKIGEFKWEIAEEAKNLGAELRILMGEDKFRQNMQVVLDVALGAGDRNRCSLTHRRSALELIKKTLKSAGETQQIKNNLIAFVPLISPNGNLTFSKSQCQPIERKKLLLAKLKTSLLATADIDFDSWQNNQLEKLLSIINLLKKINHELACLLIIRPDLKALIRENKLRGFLDSNHLEEVICLLRVNDSQLTEKKNEVERYSLPYNLEIIIIAGNRLDGEKREEIKKEIKLLGASEIKFYDAGKMRQVISAAKRQLNEILFVLSYTPHGVNYYFDSKDISYVWVETVNAKRFAIKVAKGNNRLNKKIGK